MDTRWLSAPEADVVHASASVAGASRPAWVPTWRRALIHINFSLILWYCFVMFTSLGVRVDGVGDNRTRPEDYRDRALIVLVFHTGLRGRVEQRVYLVVAPHAPLQVTPARPMRGRMRERNLLVAGAVSP